MVGEGCGASSGSGVPRAARSDTLGGMQTAHRRRVPFAPIAVAAVSVLLVLTGCSSGGSSGDGGSGATTAAESAQPAAGPEAAAAALEDGRIVIDVRTPEEYDAGHIDGAKLIDVQAASFADDIAGLDPEGQYVVYCRSGNRSAQAAAEMQAAGLDVVDGGAMADMQAAGWKTAG